MPLHLHATTFPKIVYYTTASPNYFPASPGNISPNPPDNLSKYLLASLAISPFYKVQAYNVVTNKPPIPPRDTITPPTILTPSPVLPPSPLFDPRHFFVPEELLPPKKQIHPPSSSLTTLSNSSRKQASILPFHKVEAYNVVANKPPIPPQDHITPPTILTPSPVLPPSPLLDPRHFFVLEELLPPKKQIHPLSSSLTTLSNSSRKQACILVPPSFSTYTPIPPQIYELGKSSIKMRVKHHEEQVESILSYLEELSFHYIEKMEERLVNGWIIIPRDFDEVKTKLKEARTQIHELQKKRMGQRNKISVIHFRISDLEMTLEDIQDRHQLYVRIIWDTLRKLQDY
nr:hypothetical protein [Tanacetum cinerariifolium]